mmetsp:Transcript_25557/g.47656  ORF Transcript_25557/g.47656 Transcript_25557/m.47656 type:complete len:162 (-) Transcript_25557:150-635(-)
MDEVSSSSEDAAETLRELTDEKLKETFHWTVAKMCEEEGAKSEVAVSKEFVYCLTELAFQWSGRFAKDLEAFATHAGRKVVRPDDVLLLVRNNESAKDSLLSFMELRGISLKPKSSKNRRRKKRVIMEAADEEDVDDVEEGKDSKPVVLCSVPDSDDDVGS